MESTQIGNPQIHWTSARWFGVLMSAMWACAWEGGSSDNNLLTIAIITMAIFGIGGAMIGWAWKQCILAGSPHDPSCGTISSSRVTIGNAMSSEERMQRRARWGAAGALLSTGFGDTERHPSHVRRAARGAAWLTEPRQRQQVIQQTYTCPRCSKIGWLLQKPLVIGLVLYGGYVADGDWARHDPFLLWMISGVVFVTMTIVLLTAKVINKQPTASTDRSGATTAYYPCCGQSYRTFPAGWRLVAFPDGVELGLFPDGTRYHRTPNGLETWRTVNGECWIKAPGRPMRQGSPYVLPVGDHGPLHDPELRDPE